MSVAAVRAQCLTGVPSPKYEVRAVWLTTIGGIDWPHGYAQSARSVQRQKDELRTILNKLQRANINTVLLQTRIRATTIYPSRLEPWDGCLSGVPGKSPGYDALAFAIEECHRRGMELHAWVVAIPVGKWNGAGCRKLRARHPELVRKIGDEGFMNPERPRTADYIADICDEITRCYDIDGIHLDYIRYPETWNISVPLQRGRSYITNIVRTVSKRVKARKPWVKMSCSPIGKFDDLSRFWSHGWNAYTRVCQDAQGWLREGIMDELFPMMYFRGEQFYPFAVDWAEQSYGRIVAPGLGIYFMSPREKDWPLDDITREMEVTRQYGMGHAFFRSKFFTDDTKGIFRFTERFNGCPALVPPMTWERSSKPDTPTGLGIVPCEGKKVWRLGWTPADRDTVAVRYNVYSSRRCPVDVSVGDNILAVRLKRWHLLVPADSSRYYAVTAVDRYGNESKPVQLRDADDGQYVEGGTAKWAAWLLPCDNSTVMLPESVSVINGELVTIESVYGRAVATSVVRNGRVGVSRLDDGLYTVRSFGKKGQTHRLGRFMIKRQRQR